MQQNIKNYQAHAIAPIIQNTKSQLIHVSAYQDMDLILIRLAKYVIKNHVLSVMIISLSAKLVTTDTF
jgi:hypothetical protein